MTADVDMESVVDAHAKPIGLTGFALIRQTGSVVGVQRARFEDRHPNTNAKAATLVPCDAFDAVVNATCQIPAGRRNLDAQRPHCTVGAGACVWQTPNILVWSGLQFGGVMQLPLAMQSVLVLSTHKPPTPAKSGLQC